MGECAYYLEWGKHCLKTIHIKLWRRGQTRSSPRIWTSGIHDFTTPGTHPHPLQIKGNRERQHSTKTFSAMVENVHVVQGAWTWAACSTSHTPYLLSSLSGLGLVLLIRINSIHMNQSTMNKDQPRLKGGLFCPEPDCMVSWRPSLSQHLRNQGSE